GKFSLGVRQVLDTAGDDRRALDGCAARVKDLTTDHLWPGGLRRLRLGALGGTPGQLVEGVRTRRWIGSGQCRCAGEAGGREQAVPDQNRNDEKPERVSAVQDMSTMRRRWRCTHGYFRQYSEQECAQRKSFCGYNSCGVVDTSLRLRARAQAHGESRRAPLERSRVGNRRAPAAVLSPRRLRPRPLVRPGGARVRRSLP